MSELIEAVIAADRERIRELLASGTAVDAADEHGWTALSWAAGRGDAEAVALLLAGGSDVFHRGRDDRTPYLIALAAGRRNAARLLREAELRSDPQRRGLYPARPYCRAYPLAELRRFPGWQELPAPAAGDSLQAEDDAAPPVEEVVFVHQDLTVTRSAWHGEQVLFVSSAPDWQEFCATTLGFHVPDDLDLLPADEHDE